MFFKMSSQPMLSDLMATEGLRAGRQQEAEQDYLTGLAKLQVAEREGYQNKRTVLTAYRHLATAIHKHRSEARYQSAMAYLLLLTGNTHRALRYVAEALRLEPANPRALMLQQEIHRLQQTSPARLRLVTWQAIEDSPQPQQSDDYDLLYDELESFIEQEVRSLMQQSISTEATLEMALAQEQACLHEQLEALEHILHQKISILEAEIETQPLTAMLKPLQVMRRRLEMALEHHTLFHLLLDGIEGAREDLQHLKQSLMLEQPGEDLNIALNSLLDLCDELADQLDALSEHRALQGVVSRYEVLVQELASVQDRMDGV